MDFNKKDQNQTAGDNAVQTQIETQNNYSVTNHIYNIIQSTEDVIANATEDRREELTIEGCNTSLWKRTLGLDDKNVEPLRESFLDARKKTEFILGKIRKVFPNLTMHETTHVDSLWKVADVIIGDNYINPLEGYVLGIAFLIHDVALSHEAFGGVEKLRDTAQWKDAFADGSDEQNEEEFKKECDYIAIRAIHVKKAEGILEEPFQLDDGTEFYIIENNTYRTNFGKLIGEIAASHHWKNIDEVESKFKNKRQINPLSWMPREWKINAQKLACIFRCADVGHIDDGRAPDSILNSLDVNGVSQQHWESYNHLCQVCEDDDDTTKLCITSSHPFLKKDFDAWNVAFDAVRLFDEELKKSNDLLKRNTPNNSKDLSFPHKGISGAESKEALAKYIETDGWQPCSFGVHTSNVKALIENLGGSKLYGEKNMLFVALRELIQNARDAIHARKKMDNGFDDGQITIRLNEDRGKRWIEVEDNGIGMSLDCIKYNLLDFGSSYWKSSLAKYENPGLRRKGFKSIGKFGIGFYSVFMVAKSVVVVTRRYEGNDDANIIEFPEGLTLSPILSTDKLSTRISTIVRFELKDDVNIKFSIKYHYNAISLQKALSLIVAGFDTDVFYEESGKKVRVHQNITSPTFDKKDWLRQLFVDRFPKDFDTVVNRLDFLKDDEENVMGLLAIANEDYLSFFYDNNDFKVLTPSIEAVCGLATSFDSIWVQKGFIGFIDGRENNVSRNDIILDSKTASYLQKWIKERYDADYNKIIDPEESLSSCYYSAFSYCGMDLNEIVEDNIRTLYVTFKQRDVEIGTIKGLMRIHVLLFAGTSTFVGQYRVHDVYFYQNGNNKKTNVVSTGALDDVLRYIEEMPEDSCEQIICKYFKMLIAHPFTDGNGRVGRIWVNLMLDRFMSKMIDWGNVDNSVLNEMVFSKSSSIERSPKMFKEERFEDASRYLEQFLIPSNTYIAIMTAQRNENQ